MGSVPMLRRWIPAGRAPSGSDPPGATLAPGLAWDPPARGTAAQVAHQGPAVGRPDRDPRNTLKCRCAEGSVLNLQPRGKPRAPPLRLAFFSRLSYWCDIRWAWIWEMKSITTTTTISSDVPPK